MEGAPHDAGERQCGEQVELQHTNPLEHAREDGRKVDLKDSAKRGDNLDERHEDLGAHADARETAREREREPPAARAFSFLLLELHVQTLLRHVAGHELADRALPPAAEGEDDDGKGEQREASHERHVHAKVAVRRSAVEAQPADTLVPVVDTDLAKGPRVTGAAERGTIRVRGRERPSRPGRRELAACADGARVGSPAWRGARAGAFRVAAADVEGLVVDAPVVGLQGQDRDCDARQGEVHGVEGNRPRFELLVAIDACAVLEQKSRLAATIGRAAGAGGRCCAEGERVSARRAHHRAERAELADRALSDRARAAIQPFGTGGAVADGLGAGRHAAGAGGARLGQGRSRIAVVAECAGKGLECYRGGAVEAAWAWARAFGGKHALRLIRAEVARSAFVRKARLDWRVWREVHLRSSQVHAQVQIGGCEYKVDLRVYGGVCRTCLPNKHLSLCAACPVILDVTHSSTFQPQG